MAGVFTAIVVFFVLLMVAKWIITSLVGHWSWLMFIAAMAMLLALVEL